MAEASKSADSDTDKLSALVAQRFGEVPWQLFDSPDLAASGETRYMVSRIQGDLLKIAAVDQARAGRLWDEHVPKFVARPPELPAVERAALEVNAIAPGRPRRRAGPEVPPELAGRRMPPDLGDEPPRKPPGGGDPAPERAAQTPARSADARDGRVRWLLEGLERQYLKADDKYHFRDRGREVAFEAQDRKLLTQFDTPAVVTAMIDLAEARGWSSLKVTGTQAFRREAWLQASLRDVEVTGYRADTLDKARLDELRGQRATLPPANTVEPNAKGQGLAPRFEALAEDDRNEPAVPLTPQQSQSLAVMEAVMRQRGDGPEAVARARQMAHARLSPQRVHVGKLVEAGSAPFQDRKGEALSHFVTLADDQGKQTKVWGVDLPRALTESCVRTGETVAIVLQGRKSVEVDVRARGEADGHPRIERKAVERNRWQIVQVDGLRPSARAALQKAVERQNAPGNIKRFDRSAPSAQRPVAHAPRKDPTRDRAR